MSHQPERKENDCLNCGAVVAGRFCQNCGQENVVVKQSAAALVKHFVYDIFHFDGKFFETIKYLLFRPGFVPKQYVSGKRISYLDPIRMYLFTSALFFLVIFTFNKPLEELGKGDNRLMTPRERLDYSSSIYKQADSASQQQIRYLLDTSYAVRLTKPGSRKGSDSSFPINFRGVNYMMLVEKRDPNQGIKFKANWLGREIDSTSIKKPGVDYEESETIKRSLESFLHKLPYLLFISLPFFAMILKLLYARRKQFYYSDHAVFTLYHYIFTFVLLLLVFGFDEMAKATGWEFLDYFQMVLFACGGIYLYIAMLKFYGQKWSKTLWKFILLNILGFLMLLMLFLAFLLFAIFEN